MMNDEQVESAVRRWRPAGPGADLRARILASALPSRVPLRLVDWGLMVTAAALIVALVWPQAARTSGDPLAAIYGDRARELSERFGGDGQARQLAAIVVAADRNERMEEEQ